MNIYKKQYFFFLTLVLYSVPTVGMKGLYKNYYKEMESFVKRCQARRLESILDQGLQELQEKQRLENYLLFNPELKETAEQCLAVLSGKSCEINKAPLHIEMQKSNENPASCKKPEKLISMITLYFTDKNKSFNEIEKKLNSLENSKCTSYKITTDKIIPTIIKLSGANLHKRGILTWIPKLNIPTQAIIIGYRLELESPKTHNELYNMLEILRGDGLDWKQI